MLVRWLDDRNLEIVCDDAYCVKYGIAEMVPEWRGVKIRSPSMSARRKRVCTEAGCLRYSHFLGGWRILSDSSPHAQSHPMSP